MFAINTATGTSTQVDRTYIDISHTHQCTPRTYDPTDNDESRDIMHRLGIRHDKILRDAVCTIDIKSHRIDKILNYRQIDASNRIVVAMIGYMAVGVLIADCKTSTVELIYTTKLPSDALSIHLVTLNDAISENDIKIRVYFSSILPFEIYYVEASAHRVTERQSSSLPIINHLDVLKSQSTATNGIELVYFKPFYKYATCDNHFVLIVNPNDSENGEIVLNLANTLTDLGLRVDALAYLKFLEVKDQTLLAFGGYTYAQSKFRFSMAFCLFSDGDLTNCQLVLTKKIKSSETFISVLASDFQTKDTEGNFQDFLLFELIFHSRQDNGFHQVSSTFQAVPYTLQDIDCTRPPCFRPSIATSCDKTMHRWHDNFKYRPHDHSEDVIVYYDGKSPAFVELHARLSRDMHDRVYVMVDGLVSVWPTARGVLVTDDRGRLMVYEIDDGSDDASDSHDGGVSDSRDDSGTTDGIGIVGDSDENVGNSSVDIIEDVHVIQIQNQTKMASSNRLRLSPDVIDMPLIAPTADSIIDDLSDCRLLSLKGKVHCTERRNPKIIDGSILDIKSGLSNETLNIQTWSDYRKSQYWWTTGKSVHITTFEPHLGSKQSTQRTIKISFRGIQSITHICLLSETIKDSDSTNTGIFVSSDRVYYFNGSSYYMTTILADTLTCINDRYALATSTTTAHIVLDVSIAESLEQSTDAADLEMYLIDYKIKRPDHMFDRAMIQSDYYTVWFDVGKLSQKSDFYRFDVENAVAGVKVRNRFTISELPLSFFLITDTDNPSFMLPADEAAVVLDYTRLTDGGAVVKQLDHSDCLVSYYAESCDDHECREPDINKLVSGCLTADDIALTGIDSSFRFCRALQISPISDIMPWTTPAISNGSSECMPHDGHDEHVDYLCLTDGRVNVVYAVSVPRVQINKSNMPQWRNTYIAVSGKINSNLTLYSFFNLGQRFQHNIHYIEIDHSWKARVYCFITISLLICLMYQYNKMTKNANIRPLSRSSTRVNNDLDVTQ